MELIQCEGYETDVLTGTNYNLDTNTVINAKQSLLLLQNNDDFIFVNMNTIENMICGELISILEQPT